MRPQIRHSHERERQQQHHQTGRRWLRAVAVLVALLDQRLQPLHLPRQTVVLHLHCLAPLVQHQILLGALLDALLEPVHVLLFPLARVLRGNLVADLTSDPLQLALLVLGEWIVGGQGDALLLQQALLLGVQFKLLIGRVALGNLVARVSTSLAARVLLLNGNLGGGEKRVIIINI